MPARKKAAAVAPEQPKPAGAEKPDEPTPAAAAVTTYHARHNQPGYALQQAAEGNLSEKDAKAAGVVLTED